MSKHFSERVDEEFKQRAEIKAKKENQQDLAASGGEQELGASGNGGDGVNSIESPEVPLPVAKTPEEMNQNPQAILEQGASGGDASASGTLSSESASGGKGESASGSNDTSKNIKDPKEKEVDEETVKMMGATSRFAMDQDQAKRVWESITIGAKHKISACMKEMEGKVKDPGAFCNWLAQQNGYDPNK